MFPNLNLNLFLRGYRHSMKSKTSFIISGGSFILTLKISMSNFCKLRSWILKELSFARSSTLNFGLGMQFLRLFHGCNLYGCLIYDCETSKQLEHKKNWDVMKALKRSFLWSNFKEYAILAKAFNFWLAFLQKDLTWGSNVSLLSIWIPRSFSHLLLEISISPMLILISCAEYVRRCDFSGFSFRRLSVNHLNKVSEIFPRSCNTLFKFMLDEWGVLSSA